MNIETTRSLEGLVQANVSMAQSHRDLAEELKKTNRNITDRWDRLNANAWKALGAIGLSILAAVAGVAFQNLNLAHTAATQAAQQVAAQQPMRGTRP